MSPTRQEEQLRLVCDKLSQSKFRSSFHLKERDILYIRKQGIQKIREHAFDFIRKRLAQGNILNDGKQTPMRGHPVFIAQHATATCCRECLYKWHHIEAKKELSEHEINYIVSLILYWIVQDMKKSSCESNCCHKA